MLTKKYFKAIANIIKHAKDKEDLIDLFVNYCRYDNPEFNERKFREACGGKR